MDKDRYKELRTMINALYVVDTDVARSFEAFVCEHIKPIDLDNS
jgi:hypothetical protein